MLFLRDNIRHFSLCHNLKTEKDLLYLPCSDKIGCGFLFFFPDHIFSSGVGSSVLIKMEDWKRKFEQMDLSYQATLSFPGNGKRIGADAKWILFLFIYLFLIIVN